MAWNWDTDNGACFTGSTGQVIYEANVLVPGKYYFVEFTVNSTTQGKIILESISGKYDVSINGTYQVFGQATQSSLSFMADSLGGDMFNGCIDNISARETPLYRIEDNNGNVIYQQPDNDLVTASDNNIQYGVNWNEIAVGTYRIIFDDDVLTYESYCLCVKTESCSILLSWTNDENAGGFNYDDLNFTQNLRVIAKLWHPTGKSIEQDVFRYSDGSKKMLYSEVDIQETLTIREIPAYLHRALALGLNYDHLYINGVEYIIDQQDTVPAWRKSSQLAPIEVLVTEKNTAFINQNCKS